MAVADDVYPGTKHNGTSVSSLYLLKKMEKKTIQLFQYKTKNLMSKFCFKIILFELFFCKKNTS